MYIIEDLAYGGELLERLASRGGYSERDAAKSIYDAVKALEVYKIINLTNKKIKLH